MTKILPKQYVIMTGYQPEDHPIAICTDRTTASNWCDFLNSKYAEELGLDEIEPRYWLEELTSIPKGTKPYVVSTYEYVKRVNDNGAMEKEHVYINTDAPFVTVQGRYTNAGRSIDCMEFIAVRYCRAPIYNDQAGRIEVKGLNKDNVEKLFRAKVALWKKGKWGGRDFDDLVEMYDYSGKDLIETILATKVQRDESGKIRK